MNPNRISFAALLAILSAGAQAQSLSLKDYLGQVSGGNKNLQASRKLIEAARASEDRGSMLFTPFALADAKYFNDQNPRMLTAFQGNKNVVSAWDVGAGMQTRFGLGAQLSFGTDYTQITGAVPLYMPTPNFNDAFLKLELRQSLWKNGFGRSLEAQEEAALRGARAQADIELFKVQMTLAQAEAVYWRMAVARQQVGIARDSVERSRKIRDWTSGKADVNLIDRSNYLQAEAGLKAAELQLQNTLDEEHGAAREFNKMRNAIASEVRESLADPSQVIAKGEAVAPLRKGPRGDLKATREALEAARLKETISSDELNPTLDAFASVSLQGMNKDFGTALSDSVGTKHPTSAAGLSFKVPLDFSLISRLRDGFRSETESARLTAEQKTFEEDQTWDQLNNLHREVTRKIEMARALEKLQAEKFRNERERHQKGRTTTYQLVQFQQDMATAQLMRLGLEGQLLQLVAQMKTFEGSSL